MEKHRRIENQSIPEEVIQHIQSFLSGKEAARTTILSKSWHKAWLTRPNLNFCSGDIPTASAFVEFANKTLQRYDELNRNIHTFRLELDIFYSVPRSTAKELIVKAMKLGTTDLNIRGWVFTSLLPEVFEFETLVRLSLHYCVIHQNVTCSRLKFLSLSRMWAEANTFWGIISMCPLIKELRISKCKFCEDKTMESNLGLGAYDCHELKVLCLKDVEIGEWLFRYLSRFPCLKDLAFQDCFCNEEIHICSNSLERISFAWTHTSILYVTFDVPRIRKFKYSGSCVPSLSFKTIPMEREWESDITITFRYPNSWLFELIEFLCDFREFLLKLRGFLLELSTSKICLDISMSIDSSHDVQILDLIGLPNPPIVVENLKLLMNAPSPFHRALMDGLFRCCRPRFVNLYWLTSWYVQHKANNDFTELFCKTVVKEIGEKQCMSAFHDLEAVKFEFFEDDRVEGCRPLPCVTLSDASAYSRIIEIKVCLQLRWGESTKTSE